MPSRMKKLMECASVILSRGDEKFWRGQRNPINLRAIEGLHSTMHDFRRLWHATDYLGARRDRLVLPGFGLWKFFKNSVRKFALFEIKNAVVAQNESAPLDGGGIGSVAIAVRIRFLDLPEGRPKPSSPEFEAGHTNGERSSAIGGGRGETGLNIDEAESDRAAI